MIIGKNHCGVKAQTVPSGNEYAVGDSRNGTTGMILSPDYDSFAASFDLSLLPGEEYGDGEVPSSPRFQQILTNQNFYDGATVTGPVAVTAMKMENDMCGYEFDTPPRSEYGDNDLVPVTILRYAPTNPGLPPVMSPSLLPPSPLSSCSSAPGSPSSAAAVTPDLSLVKLESNTFDARDHETLRGALEDTSFQRRLNLRPLSFEALWPTSSKQDQDETSQEDFDCNVDLLHMDLDFDGLERLDVEEDLRPVLSLALQQVKKDVMATCALLNISPDPCAWNVEQAQSWLKWTAAQFALPAPSENSFTEDGAALAQLPEQTFIAREPQSGSILHAQLEIWKAARLEQCSQLVSDAENDDSISHIPDRIEPGPVSRPMDSPTSVSSNSSGVQRQGSSHIHLWQFLKELLAGPQTHGAAIRWIDRGRGVFKIEDSVRVARLWGKRKNRPAMNYDKLSRSIRQYYKKGIMKKTERSQRLVYQFCHPYCL